MYIDLHLHTTASDGLLTPKEIVNLAVEKNIPVIAITDHDTIDGIEEAMEESAGKPVTVVPGVELSAESGGQEVHVLGYFIDYKDASFNFTLKLLREYRLKRVQRIVKRLEQIGKKVDIDRVLEIAGPGSVGRPHIAQALVEKNYASSLRDAFNRYLGTGKPAYVPRKKLTPEEAISLIKKSEGVAVLAHPGLLKDDSIIQNLTLAGLDGIEVIHKEHDEDTIKKYSKKAETSGLIKTGGSDCHGQIPYLLGTLKVPFCYYEELVRYKNRSG